MEFPIVSPKKLIEVALPLDAINAACAREKSIRQGHPSTLHLWWARRPLAAARAVLFAQLVNDPAGLWEAQNPGQHPSAQQRGAFTRRRRELFELMKELVLWKSTTNQTVLNRARGEIVRAWQEVCELNKAHPKAGELFDPETVPGFHDPFAGGGALPLEAQRLGLDSCASDLNPVAVLINKAMIEIPPNFSGQRPLNRITETGTRGGGLFSEQAFTGPDGLAEDVKIYGQWIRQEAFKRIGHLYPNIEISSEDVEGRSELARLVGKQLTVIAWIWARTVKSPHPAFSHVDVPLASTFILSGGKEGKESFIEPVVDGERYKFAVRGGKIPPAAKAGTKEAGRGSSFRCLLSNVAISGDYIKAEGQAGRMGARLMAIVAEGPDGRVYLAPSQLHEQIADAVEPSWRPDVEISGSTQYLGIKPYGMHKFGDIFSRRQTVALTTFAGLIVEVRKKMFEDLRVSGISDDGVPLEDGGKKGTAYVDAVCMFLGLSIGRLANRSSTLNFWDSDGENVQQVFARQALSMTWDYTEGNPFSSSTGNYLGQLDYLCRAISTLPAISSGKAVQVSAQSQELSTKRIISTDPPYFDNVPYADLSDFFYIWLRRSLKPLFPHLFSTVATPKGDELVAFAYRHKDKMAAGQFFLNGMSEVMQRLCAQAHGSFPVTIYYAFRAAETEVEGTASTGWETFLDAVIRSGFAITGTWPLRTEYTGNLKTKRNALASSIVLVCRKRAGDAPAVSRREFLRELNKVLPEALDEMTKGAGEERSPVAPVDLSQAIIGPGMGVFSKYSSVLEADGSAMSVRTALQLINRFLAEDDFDHDTQFCLHWFEQNGWKEGTFGEADVLARSKSTSVEGLTEAGVVASGAGKLRLLKWTEYPSEWDPRTDNRTPMWEALHQLIRALRHSGEEASGHLLAHLGEGLEAVRQLAYRLFTLCERQGWAEDARAYNELITSWDGIEAFSTSVSKSDSQLGLFGEKS